ncbi:MAG: biopolymer transporter ExbD [Pseudomonadota bacterium]
MPLIDVVLLMLIFFMIAGRLTAADPFEVAPPISLTEGPLDELGGLILMGRDGRVAFEGVEMSEEELLRAVAAKEDAPAPLDLRLKVDARAPAEGLVALLARLREAGVPEVRLLTEQVSP